MVGKTRKSLGIIVVPDEGYSRSIYTKAARLYKELQYPIIVSGADRNPGEQGAYGLKKLLERTITPIPIEEQIAMIIDMGVDPNDITYERESNNTKENAINTLELIKDVQGVQDLHLVGQLEAMYRKYLTFKKVCRSLGIRVNIIVHTTFDLLPLHISLFRLALVPSELLRIIRYRKKGDL